MASLAHLIPRYSKNFFAHNRRNISSPLSFRTNTWNNEQLSCGSMTPCWKQWEGKLLSTRSLSLTRTVQCEEVKERKNYPQKPIKRDSEFKPPVPEDFVTPLGPPPPKVYDSKITALVDQLLLLNMIEQMDFIEVFADKVGVTPEQMKAALRPQVVYAGGAPADAPVAEAAPEKPAEPVKKKEEEEKESSYTIKLTKLAEGAKFKVLKEIRSLGQLNEKITESRRFVENLPQVIKYNASKEELEAWREKITAAGGTIETETT